MLYECKTLFVKKKKHLKRDSIKNSGNYFIDKMSNEEVYERAKTKS